MAVSKAKIEPDIIDVDDNDDAALMEEARAKLAAEREENARLREQLNGQSNDSSGRDGRGLRWFFAEIWSYPQFRMLAVALVIAAWLAAGKDAGGGNLAFAVAAVFLFCKWAEVVYRDLGPGQLVLKCMAAIFGLVGMCAAFFGGNEPGAALAAGLAVLTVTALLVMSKATERLAASGMALVRFVKAWF